MSMAQQSDPDTASLVGPRRQAVAHIMRSAGMTERHLGGECFFFRSKGFTSCEPDCHVGSSGDQGCEEALIDASGLTY